MNVTLHQSDVYQKRCTYTKHEMLCHGQRQEISERKQINVLNVIWPNTRDREHVPPSCRHMNTKANVPGFFFETNENKPWALFARQDNPKISNLFTGHTYITTTSCKETIDCVLKLHYPINYLALGLSVAFLGASGCPKQRFLWAQHTREKTFW